MKLIHSLKKLHFQCRETMKTGAVSETMMNKARHPLSFNMTDCDITAHTSLQLSHTLPMTSAAEISA